MMEERGGEQLFIADWADAAFLHYEVDAGRLQEAVPFELDRFEGSAYVSLVAFTMRRMRLCRGGRATAWLTAPISEHRFLNLRTYVRGAAGPGIFFIREWVDHPLAVKLGRWTYGLPYRRSRLHYRTDKDRISREVGTPSGLAGKFSGSPEGPEFTAAPGSREAFFLERYTAYTSEGFRPLRFRVWHEPWRIRTLVPERNTMGEFLASLDMSWSGDVREVGAQFSEGVRDVWMGRPRLA